MTHHIPKVIATLALMIATSLLAGCASTPHAAADRSNGSAQVAKRADESAKKQLRAAQLREVADIAYSLSDWFAAEQAYRALLAEDNTDAAAWSRLGTVFLRSNRPTMAVTAYDAARQLGADDLALWQNTALAHARVASDAAARAHQLATNTSQRNDLARFIGSINSVVPSNLQPSSPQPTARALAKPTAPTER
jgi:predicted Zn-dependent protease